MKKIFIVILILVTIDIYSQDYSIPLNSGNDVYYYKGFTLQYDEEFEQARWVAYELTFEECKGDINRTDNFREDTQIKSGTAILDDYKYSGYDRGHLAPAGDMSWSKKAMEDSFYMSNMSPQKPYFNRIAWRILEGKVREWAIKYKKIYIVTGPVLQDPPYLTIGENKVAVPKYYYKVVLRSYKDSYKAIGFLMPNKKLEKPINDFIVSVNFIEAITKIDFFYKLENDIEETVEAKPELNLW